MVREDPVVELLNDVEKCSKGLDVLGWNVVEEEVQKGTLVDRSLKEIAQKGERPRTLR